jgi:hypothetical protein
MHYLEFGHSYKITTMVMKSIKAKFNFIVEKTTTGYSAYSDNYPIYTTGTTLLELHSNIVEAFNLFLEDQCKFLTITNIHFLDTK